MKGHVRFVQDNAQLVFLREMGFLDDEKNELVLGQCDGDIDRAIDMLFASAADNAEKGATEVDSGTEQKDKPRNPLTSTEKEDNKPTTSTDESSESKAPAQQPKTDTSAETREISALDQFRQAWINEVANNEAGEKKQDSGFATMEGSRRASDDQGGEQVKNKDKDMMSEVNQRLKAIEESLETGEDEEMDDFEGGEEIAEGEEAGAEEVQDEDMSDIQDEKADVSMSDIDAEGETDDMDDTHDHKADTSMGDIDAEAESEDVSEIGLETNKRKEKAGSIEDAKEEKGGDGKDANGEDDKAKPTHNERKRQKKQSKRRRNMAWR
ncbi:hypothetical protein BKA63DRAFT_516016 [Paraphoma chrysanthemicola]|nr:hypothetical protein BKA63DRAFT_516016 [Paraphoma chrysanthemicola]